MNPDTHHSGRNHMNTQNFVPWHAQPPQRCLEQLGSNSHTGLSADEVAAGLAKHGANRLAEKTPRPAWLKFLD
ncbi:MAG: cation-transporting P-type ATPase, partial [Desulfuromonadales bacterium]|nr:cation-transporting P-type ATPase [Desulfuromonadales bacterium]